MDKVVLNVCYGGFGLSKKAREWLKPKGVNHLFVDRHDPLLVQVVEEMGEEANDIHSKLKIIEIPSELIGYYRIHEYDGKEDLREYDLFRWVLNHLDELIPENVEEWKQRVHRIKELADNNKNKK